ncbi:unnamed protein product [Porites lobata]|uniref:Uncharacterized protein n=1 Tax=Porites lobata TaxID=104759 RepID=A0ABN8PJ45_9CNID|nr:unnamed protein product [Porites lobata]
MQTWRRSASADAIDFDVTYKGRCKYRILQPNHGYMQSFSRKTACAYGKYEQEIGFIFSEPEETGRKNASAEKTLQQENVKLRTELSKQERLNNTKRGSKRKRAESKLEVPVDLRSPVRGEPGHLV